MPFRPAKPLVVALVLALGATGAIAATAAETAIATRQASFVRRLSPNQRVMRG